MKRPVLAVLFACFAAAPVHAQSSEAEFFHGKTVRIVVGSGSGGGYDIYARLIAPYLSRALNATAIVEN